MEVTIYSRENCKYCTRAKQFFKNKNITYTELRVGDHLTTEQYTKKTGMQSVPAIYFDDNLIGGYDDMVEYILKNPGVI